MSTTHSRQAAGRSGGVRRPRRWHSIPLGILLAGVLLAGLPAAAQASAPEMSGEWELVLTSPSSSRATARAIVSAEANQAGEFAASSLQFEGVDPGTFSGTLKGSEASVKVTLQAYGPIQAGEYISTNMQITSNGGSLSMTGTGILDYGGQDIPETLVATRTKTHKEVEERELREKKEQEEQEARQNIRGEWELTLSSGVGTVKGKALIVNAASAPTNEFASSGALFESVIPGTFSGKLEGSNASVKVTTEAAGPFPASEFTSAAITVTSAVGSMSMSGSGTGTLGPATFTATRLRTYKQIEEQQAKEAKEAQEAKEAKEAQEAKEANEAQQAKEAKEKQAREAAEKLAKEAALKSPPTSIVPPNTSQITLVSAAPANSTFSVGGSGSLSLELSNPNNLAIEGHFTLTTTSAGKAARAKSKTKTVLLGGASFTISAKGHETLKIKLSKGNYATLVGHKKLHAVLTISTTATGKSPVTKTYDITLSAPKSHSHKH